ncbi:MAG: hypothetical protein ACRCYR_09800 [Phycicoccus sp.]
MSRKRVEACLRSALLWTDELPRYADFQQSKADWWSLVAGVVAALTGLSIFPVLSDSSTTLEKVLVAAFAFAAGICALVPRIKNYGEMAGRARELAAVYSTVQGDLLDGLVAIDAGRANDDALRAAVKAFQEAKAKKDQLRYLRRGARIAKLRAGSEDRFEVLIGR